MASATYTIVTNRIVLTYQPAEWPEGALTGYRDLNGGIVLEHVMAFKPGVLLPLLRTGIEAAQDLCARYIIFGIPDAFPLARQLGLAAKRVGCEVYEHRDGWTYWVRWL